jgi:hypothetical protein
MRRELDAAVDDGIVSHEADDDGWNTEEAGRTVLQACLNAPVVEEARMVVRRTLRRTAVKQRVLVLVIKTTQRNSVGLL